MSIHKLAEILFVILAILTLLVLGKEILIPLIVAIVIWFIIKELREFFDQVYWIKNKLPKWLRSTIASLIVFSSLAVIFSLLANNMNELKNSLPVYEKNIVYAKLLINKTFSIDLNNLFSDYLLNFDFNAIISLIINSISNIFGNVFLVLIYILFLFIEESSSVNKLRYVYSDEKKYQQTKHIIADIDRSIGSYIALKTLVSIISGVVGYVILSFIGIDSPFFWSFLIMILNFVPVIGALVGILFPTIIALLQFGEITPAIMVLVLGGTAQALVGNVLEPKIMGSSLNVSSLVVILSLAIWGSIWGIFGMVISVPTTVILIIIFSRFESTRNIAILLSEKGKIVEGK